MRQTDGGEIAEADKAVSFPEGEGVTRQPKGQTAETQIGKVLDQDVGRVLGPYGAGLEKGESGLHQQDHRAHDGEEKVVDVGHKHFEAFFITREIGQQLG